MSQTPPGSMATNAIATSRVPAAELRVAWAGGALVYPSNWTADGTVETSRLLEASWSRQLDLDAPLGLGRGPAAEMTVTLANYDQRYSPYNESGALYAYLSADGTLPDGITTVRYPTVRQIPIRLRTGFGSDYVDSFCGHIDELEETYSASGDAVTLRCLDRASKLIELNTSTRMFTNIATDDWMRYLVETVGGIPVTYANTDRGFFLLPYAWMDDENVWQEVQLTAAAEGGYAFFDESGAFQSRNAAWFAAYSDSYGSQFEFTTARFSDITPGYGYGETITGAVVEYQPRTFGGEQVVWTASGTIVAPPGEKFIDVKLQYPCERVYTPVAGTDYKASNAGGFDMSDNVSIGISQPYHYAQRTRLSILNSSHETCFVSGARLRGLVVIGGPSEEVARDASAPLVPTNVKRIAGNAYIQQESQAQLIADLAVDRMSFPRLTYRLSGVPAIPWLQLGDRITITAAKPITTSRYAIITGLSFQWKPDAVFTMTVDCIDTLALYSYAALFKIGTSEYGGEYAFR